MQQESALEIREHNYNRRSEERIDLSVTLFVRRPNNSLNYRRPAETINVSRRGALIILDVSLEIGAQLEVTGFDDMFSARAVVHHIEERWDGRWSIGLKFLTKTGIWVIY